jgi:bacterioferritin-associated ferredoxin
VEGSIVKERSRSTVVCRCENVTTGELADVLAVGARTFDEVKRVTRAGMGVCQGRTCECIVTDFLLDDGRIAPADLVPRSVRPPVRPITLEVLAAAEPDAPRLPDEP